MEDGDMVRIEDNFEKSNSNNIGIPDEKIFVKVKHGRHKIYASNFAEGKI